MPQLSIDHLLAKQEITELLYPTAVGSTDSTGTWCAAVHDDAFDDQGLVRAGSTSSRSSSRRC
jgi:hypothetical protein